MFVLIAMVGARGKGFHLDGTKQPARCETADCPASSSGNFGHGEGDMGGDDLPNAMAAGRDNAAQTKQPLCCNPFPQGQLNSIISHQ